MIIYAVVLTVARLLFVRQLSVATAFILREVFGMWRPLQECPVSYPQKPNPPNSRLVAMQQITDNHRLRKQLV